MVTPYEQARDYVSQLSLSEKPRYIITCNFQKIRIYDCNIQPSYNRKTEDHRGLGNRIAEAFSSMQGKRIAGA